MTIGAVFEETSTQLSPDISALMEPYLSNPESDLSVELKTKVKISVMEKKSEQSTSFILCGQFIEIVYANEIIYTFMEKLKDKLNSVFTMPSIIRKNQTCLLNRGLYKRELEQENICSKYSNSALKSIATLNSHHPAIESSTTNSNIITVNPLKQEVCSVVEVGLHKKIANFDMIQKENILEDNSQNEEISSVMDTQNNDNGQSEEDNSQKEERSSIMDTQNNINGQSEDNAQNEERSSIMDTQNSDNGQSELSGCMENVKQSEDTCTYNLRKSKPSFWVKKLLSTSESDKEEDDFIGLEDDDSDNEYKLNESDEHDTESKSSDDDVKEDKIIHSGKVFSSLKETSTNSPVSEMINLESLVKHDRVDMHHQDVDVNPDVTEDEETEVYAYKKHIGKMTRDEKDPSLAKSECLFCTYVNISKYPNPKKRLQGHYGRSHVVRDPIYECQVCGRKFGAKADLTKHKQKHEYKECEQCGKVVKRICYPAHALHHKEGYIINKHECEICKKKYPSRYALQEHIKNIHKGERTLYPCQVCKKVLSTKHSLASHIKYVHGSEDKMYMCETCGKSFYTARNLKSHMQSHDEVPQFVCSTCKKAFRFRAGLLTHMLTHTNERYHLCSECGKSFSQKSALNRHIRVHTGERPFECSVCGEKFNDSSILRRHMAFKHKQ